MAYARIERWRQRSAAGLGQGTFSPIAVLEAGALAGGAGAVLMMVWWMAQAAATGYGPLFPLNQVGAAFRGAEALVGGPTVMLSGLFLHAVTSIVFGTLFSAAVTTKTRLPSSLIGGMVYAMLVLLFMTYVVLPYANPIMRPRVVASPGAWFFSHVAFGLGVGLAPLIKRRLAGRRALEDLRG
jgi:hypothetical protein